MLFIAPCSYKMRVCFRQDVVLIGKKTGNDKVQKHVQDCIGWLNAYFTDVGHVAYMRMPDICVAREMGKLPYWCVEFSFLIFLFFIYYFYFIYIYIYFPPHILKICMSSGHNAHFIHALNCL